MSTPTPSPVTNFQFSKIGKPPTLLGRIATVDPNMPSDFEIDAPPSPPPAASTSTEQSNVSLGRLAVLVPQSEREPAHVPPAPAPRPFGIRSSTSSQGLVVASSALTINSIQNLPSEEAARLLWHANNSDPSAAPTLPSSASTSFYFRAAPSTAPVSTRVSLPEGPSTAALTPTPAVQTSTATVSDAATSNTPLPSTMQVDTPSRPPEQQPPHTRTTSNSPLAPSASAESLRLSEELRDAKIELDEVRRVRERVADEYKEFRHRYQETIHALEREKAQMERVVAVTEEWFVKSEKIIERSEQKLAEQHALYTKRAQEEEHARGMERAEAEERARAAAEERMKLEIEKRKKAEAEETARIEKEMKACAAKVPEEAQERQRLEAEAKERERAAQPQFSTSVSRGPTHGGTLTIQPVQTSVNAPMALAVDRPTTPAIVSPSSTPNKKQRQTVVSTAPTSGTVQSPRSSTHTPLSLGQPSIEVRPVTPLSNGSPTNMRSNMSRLTGPVSHETPSRPPQMPPQTPSSSGRLASSASSGARRVQQLSLDANKEELLKAKLLEKKKGAPESAHAEASQAAAPAASTSGKPSSKELTRKPPPVNNAKTNSSRPAETSPPVKGASTENRPPTSQQNFTQPVSAGQSSSGHSAPPAAGAQASIVKQTGKKKGNGPSVMIKPEPSSPSLSSQPKSVAVPRPVAVSVPAPVIAPTQQPPTKPAHTLPQKPAGGPPPPRNAKGQPQAQGRVRVSSNGDRSARAPAASSSQNDTVSLAGSQDSRHSSVQGDVGMSQPARAPDNPVRPEPIVGRLGYVPDYSSMRLDDDSPWNVLVRNPIDFAPMVDRSPTPPEERQRYSWNRYSPTPPRQSPRDGYDRYPPPARSLSPVHRSPSPTRKRLRDDSRERDLLPPSRRARYSGSGSEASPRQRRAALPDIDRGRDWERPRAVTPPYTRDYPPPPRMSGVEPGTRYSDSRYGDRRTTPPSYSSIPAPSPPRGVRRGPARNLRPVDDYRSAESPAPRIAVSHRPQRPITPPTPPRPSSPTSQSLTHRIDDPISREAPAQDLPAMALLSRMSDAPALPGPHASGGRPKTNANRGRGEERGARRGRGEGKRGRGGHVNAQPRARPAPPVLLSRIEM